MWRIIDLSGENYYLHVDSTNLSISKNGTEYKTVPFQDIHSIIVHGKKNTFTEAFFDSCIRFSIPVLFCNEEHLPNGILLPYYQHSDSANRFMDQVKAKIPRQKQAWQRIVQAKLDAQALTLEQRGKGQEAKRLNWLSSKVLSGDSSNCEAVGAKIYFETLFGTGFSRRDENEVNSFLNYSYSIVRSCVARAICSCGLHPSISVFHSSNTNPYALTDDLMEPLRPIADMFVINLISSLDSVEELELEPKYKKAIISLISRPVYFGSLMYEFSGAVRMYIMDYYKFISNQSSKFTIPKMDNSTWQ